MAFAIPQGDLAKLKQLETSYNREVATLDFYDGHREKGFLYAARAGPMLLEKDVAPSKRYLIVLIKKAKAAHLKDEYIERLQQIRTYKAEKSTLMVRKTVPLSQ